MAVSPNNRFPAQTLPMALLMAALMCGASAFAQSAPQTMEQALDQAQQQAENPSADASGDQAANPPEESPAVSSDGQADGPPTVTVRLPHVMPSPAAVASGPLAGGTVSVIGAAEGPAVGLLDPLQDLGDTLWSGSDRGVVVELLGHGALVSADPMVRALARRIVLTKADAPDGAAKRSVIATRLSLLVEAGLIDEAGELAARSAATGTALTDDADFARTRAEALLYAGRDDAVCGDATARRFSDDEPFWVKLRAVCARQGGNAVLAELTEAVLPADDGVFVVLYGDLVRGGTNLPQTFAHANALDFYLLRRLKLSPTPALADALIKSGGTPENLYVLRDAALPAALRLAAAEAILRRGAVPVADLRAVMAVYAPTAVDLANAPVRARELPYLTAQALLRLACAAAARPGEKVRLMRLALDLGEQAGLLPLTAALQSDVLAGLSPDSSDAAVFARALLMAGEDKAAEPWARENDLTHAVLLLNADDPASRGALQAVLITFATEVVPAPRHVYALQLASALNVLPYDLQSNSGALLSMPLPGTRPGADVMAQISAAAGNPGRHGEALLRILDQIRAIGWAHLAPSAGEGFARLLNDMGLSDAARTFAREAVLSYAPPEPAPVQPAQPAAEPSGAPSGDAS